MSREPLLKQLVGIFQQPTLDLYTQPPFNLNAVSKPSYFDRIISDFSSTEAFDLFPGHFPGSLLIDYPFGEGYTSFFQLFIYGKNDGSTRLQVEGERRRKITDGLIFEINRHAPVAVYGAGRSETVYENDTFVAGSGGFSALDLTTLDGLPAGDWHAALQAATDILTHHGIGVLNRAHFDQAAALRTQPDVTATRLFERWFHVYL